MMAKVPEGANTLRGLWLSNKNPLEKMLPQSSLKNGCREILYNPLKMVCQESNKNKWRKPEKENMRH